MAWQCERWNALPEAGGLFDQDAKLMTRMTALSNIYATVARYRSLVGREIHSLKGSERRLLGMLHDEGMI